ncbi:MAG: sugar-binding protein [Lachnospiraceae bacterium]|nr:sugar-binding protein [Lachnospiraceae bacterium]
MKRKISVWLCIIIFVITCVSCGNYEVTEMPMKKEEENIVQAGKKVGVLMPTREVERWEDDAENIRKALEIEGYEVIVEFAENNPYTQITQMEDMLKKGVECMVVVVVDSEIQRETLEKIWKKNIDIIAYDRLIMNTEAVSYYATFDNQSIGVAMGTYIKEHGKLDEVRMKDEHKTIEFFMGDANDNNAFVIYQGIMEVLGEYLEDGTLICKSMETEFADISTRDWSRVFAKKEAARILESYCEDDSLDIACCANDTIAYGIIDALNECGYTQENWPLVTGQDAEIEAVKNIINGKQSMTLYKDTRVLADKCATMVKAVLEGTIPEINNEDEYNNGNFKVKSYLCTPIVVDKDNYREILIDSGYYGEEELK